MGFPRWTKLAFCIGLVGCNRASSPETVTAQIVAVRDAEVGAPSITVDNAIVTYIINNETTDTLIPTGFFLQAETKGPAIFVPQVESEIETMPEVGDVVELVIGGVPESGLYNASIRTKASAAPSAAGVTSMKVLVENALSYELAYDFDTENPQPASGAKYHNRIVSASLLVASRLRQVDSEYLEARVQLARPGFTEPVNLLISTRLADVTRIRRGCQMRVETVPVLKGPQGYYLLATREAELTLAMCESPKHAPAARSANAPTQPGTVVFSELMTHSVENRGKDGEWFELYNASKDSLNLIGCQLRRPKPNEPHVISEDLVLEPGEYAILSSAERPKGVNPDYVYYDDFGLLDETGRTRAALTCGANVIDMIDFTVRRVSGRSLTVSPKQLTAKKNDKLDSWCWAPSPRQDGDSNVDWSSPGTTNVPCPPR